MTKHSQHEQAVEGQDSGFEPSELRPLFRPSSIAIVGASNDPLRIGGRPLEYLRRMGFSGQVLGINPKYSTVQGYECVPSIEDARMGIELYVLAIPAAAVPDTVRRLAERGGRAAVVFGGGFSEAGEVGERLQEELQSLAQEFRIPVLGPNCLGMVSFHDAIPATFSSSLKTMLDHKPGPVAIVSQSGGFAANLAVEAAVNGANFSYMLATGNEAVVDIGEVFSFLAKDENTESIVGYLEGVKSGSNLSRGLAALQRTGKRVSLLKVGRSSLGAAAVGGHTALMSGADDSVSACFRRYGVTRLATFDEMVDAAIAGSRELSEETTGRLAVATISGGTAVYILDACEEFGVPLAELSTETLEGLEALLPNFAQIGNPVDLTAQVINDSSTLIGSLELLSSDPSVGEILFFLGGQDDVAADLLATLGRVRAVKEGRLSLAWLGVSERRRTEARDAGIKTFADPARFLRTLSATRSIEATEAAETPELDSSEDLGTHVYQESSPRQLEPLSRDDFIESPDGGSVLNEWHGMELLEKAGVRVPARWRWDRNKTSFRRLPDVRFPCVAKILWPHLTHRSRSGGVITGIEDQAGLSTAANQLHDHLGAETILVAEQVPPGIEVILGVLRDDVFGQRAVLGSGGIWANETDDSQTLIPPFSQEYVREEMSRLKIFPALKAANPHVVEGITEILLAVSDILEAEPLLDQLECNPVVVSADGVIAVDALGSAPRPNNDQPRGRKA